MSNLRMEIIDAGLNPYAEDNQLFGLEGDAEACFDARMLLDETMWQISNILREMQRRWPSVDSEEPSGFKAAKAWMGEVKALL